jgi:perosamine synthetase
MVTTDDPELARRLRLFRNHGITTDHRQRERAGSWFYEMTDLGFNYRLCDIQCALGLSQLRKLDAWINRRRELARRYDAAFASSPHLQALKTRPGAGHAYHLYVVQLTPGLDRDRVFADLRTGGIGVNVHYVPVHLHPYYRKNFHTYPGQCPVAEQAYRRILSLPMFPRLADAEQERVILSLQQVLENNQRQRQPAA